MKFCVRGRVDHRAVTNLSSNMMANWVLASLQSEAGHIDAKPPDRKTSCDTRPDHTLGSTAVEPQP